MIKLGVPLGRLGKKKEIADAALFLASDAASYISGDMIIVDGAAYLQGQGFNKMGQLYFTNPSFKKMITGEKKSKKQQSKL